MSLKLTTAAIVHQIKNHRTFLFHTFGTCTRSHLPYLQSPDFGTVARVYFVQYHLHLQVSSSLTSEMTALAA